jgi:AMP nucleosidase
MKTKNDIVENWLPRYTGEKLSNFGAYILLTNFSNYVKLFAEWNKVDIVGTGRSMQCATAGNITIINFGMGSPGAATVMDLLTAIQPKAVLFLGKCGGLKKRNKIGDLIYLRLPFKKPSPQPYVIMNAITGREYVILLTEGFGSTMNNSKPICKK